MSQSPIILSVKGGVCAPRGFYADGLNCGLRKGEREDLAFIRSENPCEAAALFTSNRFAAAPLIHAKERIDRKVQAAVINAKNANALTGEAGLNAVKELVKLIPFENPLMSSTGVIGQPFPVEKIADGVKRFNWNAKNPDAAARAIMTTDRWDKQIAFEVQTENGTFSIGAMCKGAGMIAPQLATTLCFVTTDAALNKTQLKAHLDRCVETSFNAISVDGDMSTNDTILILANGLSGAYEPTAFEWTLEKILRHLALEVVKDGEGASKIAAFEVKGAANGFEAKKVAKALAESLLIKTALFGCDPNWGRIASTIGAAQIECDPSRLVISIGDIVVYDRGANKMDALVEEKAAAVLRTDSFKIACDLGAGEASFTAYGCDLGYEYVKINADYRT
ncbi:MAG: bifunctional glutamate N-acetyltransferase/amino-acid acetyltransferase ArgJ [Helicobacteraceae bacterium]|jgi:glutamate N-acetyltransferase/amino-acid N-acetyltransferase|nr:bifunctional glutamate N-acetyltransferase/amino-acid acetyltransferase ArgJ [Helicobacteraceae bacterium]